MEIVSLLKVYILLFHKTSYFVAVLCTMNNIWIITICRYTDMESEDYSFYQGLVFLLEHSVKELGSELTFSVEVSCF